MVCARDNPSFAIYDVASNTISPSLALTILLEAWPINLYPKLWVLPTGSTLVIAGGLAVPACVGAGCPQARL